MDCSIENLKNLCRICLSSVSNDFVEISVEAQNGITVLGMILALTIEEDGDLLSEDKYPKRICNDCFRKLINAYDLQQTLIKSREKLGLLLKTSSTNDETNFEEEQTFEERDESINTDISFEPCLNVAARSNTIESSKPKVNTQKTKIKITKLSKIECGLCDKVYGDLKAFKIHFRKHTGERPYLCSYCSKTFTDKSCLDKHVKRKHTTEGFKKHQCPYCPRKTCDVTHLRTHIQTHTGEKPDVCQICGKAFNGRTGLRMHLRTHSDERNFKCRFCDQAFKLKKYLERHEMTHQNIKPYQCQYCPSAFTQQGDMLKHLKQHDHDVSYKCEQCDETFRLKTELRRHMIVHPRIEVLQQVA